MEYRLPTCKNPWSDQLKVTTAKKIKSVNSYLHKFPFGKVSYQHLRLDKINVWWYELTIHTPCMLAVCPYECQFSLHFNLENGLTIPFDDLPVHLQEGNAYFLYMRNINYEITFEPGKYIFCQLDYNILTLQKEGETNPEISSAIQAAEQGLGCNVFTKIPIPTEFHKLLKTILTEASPLKRNDAQQIAMQLLSSFLKKSIRSSYKELKVVQYDVSRK